MEVGMNREQYVTNLRLLGGIPYLWGGWSVDGCDCSGAVSLAMLLPEKLNCMQLVQKFKVNQVDRLQAPPGSLFFYGVNGLQVDHVMSVVTHWPNGGVVLMGARGGDSTVTTLDAAKEKKAFVDICFGDYWLKRFVMAVDPFINL
jgi:hypothetical protein